MNENQITIIDENGDEQLVNILFTFESDITNRGYVVYYVPGTEGVEEEEQTEVFAARYENNEDNLSGKLEAIETDEEWEIVEDAIAAFTDDESEE